MSGHAQRLYQFGPFRLDTAERRLLRAGEPVPLTSKAFDLLVQYREGSIARGIEKQTAKLPSDTFLWAALGAIAVSASLQFMGNRQVSNFVGQWAPTFLILGLYNKMVKQLGSDRTENAI